MIPAAHAFWLAAALLAVGLLTVLLRRNLVFMLLGVEVMLNAAGLAFIAAGALRGAADGQVMFLFVLAVAAAEVSVGLALVLRLRRDHGAVDADAARELAE
jgi:NADH-quinone oxidoreductase subunit K